jgi:hypothetical protein
MVGGNEAKLFEKPLARSGSCHKWRCEALETGGSGRIKRGAECLGPLQRLSQVCSVEHTPVDEGAGNGTVDSDAFGKQGVGSADDTIAVPTPGVAAELTGVRIPSSV